MAVMTVECSWCKITVNRIEVDGDEDYTSHGMCLECAFKEKAAFLEGLAGGNDAAHRPVRQVQAHHRDTQGQWPGDDPVRRLQSEGGQEAMSMPKPPCKVADCWPGTPVYARGWCHKHYVRWRKYGDVNTVIKRTYPRGETYQKALPLIDKGMRDVDIAKRLGVSRERIRQIRAKAGKPKVGRAVYTCRSCHQPSLSGRDVQMCRACQVTKLWVTLTCAQCGKPVRKLRSQMEASKRRGTQKHGVVFCNMKERSVYFSARGIIGWKPGVSGNPACQEQPKPSPLSRVLDFVLVR